MNEAIISPWFFYAASVTDNLRVFFGISGGVCVVACIMALIICADLNTSGKTCLKWFIPFLACAIVSIFFAILLPAESTIYKMAAAKMATPANINKVIATGKDLKTELKGDLIDIIKTIGDEVKK